MEERIFSVEVLPVSLYVSTGSDLQRCLFLSTPLHEASATLSFRKFDFRYIIALGLLIPIVLFNILVLSIFVSGEEIGWRGFIQSQAIEQSGNIVGILMLRLIWGFWHAPVALRGHNLNASFWAEAFVLYPYMCICYSFPIAFLALQSGSIWPAILFHVANNALGSISIQFVEKKKPKLEILIQMVIATLFLLPFAYFLVQAQEIHRETGWQIARCENNRLYGVTRNTFVTLGEYADLRSKIEPVKEIIHEH